jgi:hypothetical protein
MRRILPLVAVLGALAVPAAFASTHPLQVYMARIGPRIDSYRAVSVALGKLLRERPVVNVDPFVERLNGIADRFARLGSRWRAITPPKGLTVRHRGMGRAFELQAQAWRIYAAAVFTRHQDELEAAGPKVNARLRSAAYLQRRWAAALRGGLIRADLSVPRWLRGMAKASWP